MYMYLQILAKDSFLRNKYIACLTRIKKKNQYRFYYFYVYIYIYI